MLSQVEGPGHLTYKRQLGCVTPNALRKVLAEVGSNKQREWGLLAPEWEEDAKFRDTWSTDLSGFAHDAACLFEPGSRATGNGHPYDRDDYSLQASEVSSGGKRL